MFSVYYAYVIVGRLAARVTRGGLCALARGNAVSCVGEPRRVAGVVGKTRDFVSRGRYNFPK